MYKHPKSTLSLLLSSVKKQKLAWHHAITSNSHSKDAVCMPLSDLKKFMDAIQNAFPRLQKGLAPILELSREFSEYASYVILSVLIKHDSSLVVLIEKHSSVPYEAKTADLTKLLTTTKDLNATYHGVKEDAAKATKHIMKYVDSFCELNCISSLDSVESHILYQYLLLDLANLTNEFFPQKIPCAYLELFGKDDYEKLYIASRYLIFASEAAQLAAEANSLYNTNFITLREVQAYTELIKRRNSEIKVGLLNPIIDGGIYTWFENLICTRGVVLRQSAMVEASLIPYLSQLTYSYADFTVHSLLKHLKITGKDIQSLAELEKHLNAATETELSPTLLDILSSEFAKSCRELKKSSIDRNVILSKLVEIAIILHKVARISKFTDDTVDFNKLDTFGIEILAFFTGFNDETGKLSKAMARFLSEDEISFYLRALRALMPAIQLMQLTVGIAFKNKQIREMLSRPQTAPTEALISHAEAQAKADAIAAELLVEESLTKPISESKTLSLKKASKIQKQREHIARCLLIQSPIKTEEKPLPQKEKPVSEIDSSRPELAVSADIINIAEGKKKDWSLDLQTLVKHFYQQQSEISKLISDFSRKIRGQSDPEEFHIQLEKLSLCLIKAEPILSSIEARKESATRFESGMNLGSSKDDIYIISMEWNARLYDLINALTQYREDYPALLDILSQLSELYFVPTFASDRPDWASAFTSDFIVYRADIKPVQKALNAYRRKKALPDISLSYDLSPDHYVLITKSDAYRVEDSAINSLLYANGFSHVRKLNGKNKFLAKKADNSQYTIEILDGTDADRAKLGLNNSLIVTTAIRINLDSGQIFTLNYTFKHLLANPISIVLNNLRELSALSPKEQAALISDYILFTYGSSQSQLRVRKNLIDYIKSLTVSGLSWEVFKFISLYYFDLSPIGFHQFFVVNCHGLKKIIEREIPLSLEDLSPEQDSMLREHCENITGLHEAFLYYLAKLCEIYKLNPSQVSVILPSFGIPTFLFAKVLECITFPKELSEPAPSLTQVPALESSGAATMPLPAEPIPLQSQLAFAPQMMAPYTPAIPVNCYSSGYVYPVGSGMSVLLIGPPSAVTVNNGGLAVAYRAWQMPANGGAGMPRP
ncbi:MAG: hypothetical protein K0R66_1146 [Gammaproteobacteria bacterium]|jgi:hypothetical protein|nr:hypothetical protein [Gammaproteobacteria bacterium]